MCLSVLFLGFILPVLPGLWWFFAFLKLENFTAIISLNIFSFPFSPFAPSGAPITQLLVHLTLFYRCLKLSSLVFLVLFSFSVAVIYTILSFSSLIHFCHIYSIIPSNVFSFQLLYSSTLFGCSLYFLTISLLSYFMHSFFSQVLDHLYYHYSELFLR